MNRKRTFIFGIEDHSIRRTVSLIILLAFVFVLFCLGAIIWGWIELVMWVVGH